VSSSLPPEDDLGQHFRQVAAGAKHERRAVGDRWFLTEREVDQDIAATERERGEYEQPDHECDATFHIV
jgi:hypothetical protein